MGLTSTISQWSNRIMGVSLNVRIFSEEVKKEVAWSMSMDEEGIKQEHSRGNGVSNAEKRNIEPGIVRTEGKKEETSYPSLDN